MENYDIPCDELLRLIDTAVERVLSEAGVYNIDSHGWLDVDTVDPEFAGHAMWQISPPYEFLFYSSRPHRRPNVLDCILTVSGNDFIGLMHAARDSIGLCLLHKSLAEKRPLEIDKKFWLHHASSLMFLNIASDRMRKFFIAASFKCSSADYESKSNKSKKYTAPFVDACAGCKGGDVALEELFEEVKELSNSVFEYRGKRNKMVHEVLSPDGNMHVKLMDIEKESFDGSCEKPSRDFFSGFPDIDYVLDKNNEELSMAVSDIVGWYKVLVRFSSLIFEIECFLRQGRVG
jgi:hypothetical protein